MIFDQYPMICHTTISVNKLIFAEYKEYYLFSLSFVLIISLFFSVIYYGCLELFLGRQKLIRRFYERTQDEVRQGY